MKTKYRVEYPDSPLTSACWFTRSQPRRPADGAPNYTNLHKHLDALNASFRPDGVNAAAGPLFVHKARIVDQDTDKVVIEVSKI